MKILAVDASTEACSAALLIDGQVIEKYELAPQRHTQLLMPMVKQLLDEAGISLNGIDGYAFGHGPGSFTGLRIATALVQGLALGTHRPVIGVSTLAALAQATLQARKDENLQIAAALDARMGQVYWGVYRADTDGRASPVEEDSLLDPDMAPKLGSGSWSAVGSGWRAHGAALLQSTGLNGVVPDGDAYPHAGDIARLAMPILERGGGVVAAAATPVYLRNQVAEKMR